MGAERHAMGVASRGSHGLGGVNGKGLTGRKELAIHGGQQGR